MKRKILVRFDDICPTMDFTQWERADKILRKYQIKPLLGVIPECKDPELHIEPEHKDFWEWIKNLQSQGYTLAMHGCYHLYRTKCRGIVNSGYNSEFAGLPFEEQYQLIIYGKKKLKEHGIDTDIFFAPAHSYDENTLKALAKAGFKYVSDGKSRKPYELHGIKCIPCRSVGCPRIYPIGNYTAVFHAHEWVRPDKARGYDLLEKLCRQYHSDIVDFHEYSRQSSGNLQIQRIDEKIYLGYQRNILPILSKVKHSILK